MKIIQYRKIFYSISAALIFGSILSLTLWGLNLGVDFKGGTIIEIEYEGSRPNIDEVKMTLASLELNENIRPTDETGYILRMREVDQDVHSEILKLLSFDETKPVTEKRFSTIGPLLGKEATSKAIVSVLLVLVAIILFITIAFRKVSEPISSWKYGIIAIIALFHDVLIPTGVFSILGHFSGYEVDTLFVTALLVVLGFSVHDTIVVFDRVRENLNINKEKNQNKSFEVIVGESITQTFTRSINTSLTTLLALAVLYYIGAEATRNFSLALLIGITAGTYSSIFIGSPLLVTLGKWQNRSVKKK